MASEVKTVTFQIEVETSDPSRFEGVRLSLLREGSPEWQDEVTFMLPRPQRVRDGKHLLITQNTGKVVRVGNDKSACHGDVCPKCHGVVVWEEAEDECGHDLKCNECGEIYKSV